MPTGRAAPAAQGSTRTPRARTPSCRCALKIYCTSCHALYGRPSMPTQHMHETRPRPHQGACSAFLSFDSFTLQFALKREGEADGHPLGKISFIDLAGSERGADTYDNNR